MTSPAPLSDDRTAAQRAHEAAMTEVAESIALIEQAIRRAERGLATVEGLPGRSPALAALGTTIIELKATRDDLFRKAYFTGTTPDDHHPDEVDVTDVPTSLF